MNYCNVPLFLTGTLAFAVSSLYLNAADHDFLGTVHVKDVGSTQAMILLDEKNLGGSGPNSYLRAMSSGDATRMIFGGYYSQHQFLWEVSGDAGFPAKDIMFLDYDGVLQVLSADNGDSYITLDPSSSTLSFSHSNGGFSLCNDAGVLKVGDSTVVTQDASGNIDLGAAGTIAQDLTIGDGDAASPGLTVDDTLVIKHPTDSAYDALLKVEDMVYDSGGSTHTDSVLSSNLSIRVGNIGLGKSAVGNYQYPGLYSFNDKMVFDIHDGVHMRRRLQLENSMIRIIGPTLAVRRWPTSDDAFSVDVADETTNVIKLRAGSNNTVPADIAQALGDNLKADSYASVVIGRYNAAVGEDGTSNDRTTWMENEELFVIGNGADDANRSNALVVYKNGDIVIPKRQGDISMGNFQ